MFLFRQHGLGSRQYFISNPSIRSVLETWVLIQSKKTPSQVVQLYFLLHSVDSEQHRVLPVLSRRLYTVHKAITFTVAAKSEPSVLISFQSLSGVIVEVTQRWTETEAGFLCWDPRTQISSGSPLKGLGRSPWLHLPQQSSFDSHAQQHTY